MKVENLKLVRTMWGGPDEAGFILVHVALEALTGELIKSKEEVVEGGKLKDRDILDSGLRRLGDVLTEINDIRETMWKHSRPNKYLDLRTWIMGIEGNTGEDKIFPKDGVEYEGVDPKYHIYRGETGAQSSIIPLSDVLTGVDRHYPDNALTKYLLELRSYRPRRHRTLLEDTKKAMNDLDIVNFMTQEKQSEWLRLRAMDQIRRFRSGHWMFTKQYIIQNTGHPVATGGTPITTWLPNNLGMYLCSFRL